MKLVTASRKGLIDKIIEAFDKIHEAYHEFGEVAYVDGWEWIEGDVILTVGLYDKEEHELDWTMDISLPFSPRWDDEKELQQENTLTLRKELEKMFDRQFSIFKCEGEDRFGFYIMVNAMRFIDDENDGSSRDTEDEVYDEDEVSEESQPTVTTE